MILLLEATTGIGQVIQFLRDLCMKPAIRLLKLVGNHGERVGVWVALREPLDLMGMLPKIEGVSLVTELRRAEPRRSSTNASSAAHRRFLAQILPAHTSDATRTPTQNPFGKSRGGGFPSGKAPGRCAPSSTIPLRWPGGNPASAIFR